MIHGITLLLLIFSSVPDRNHPFGSMGVVPPMALSGTVSNMEEGSASGPTVIAIDRDHNSQYAVKWAVDHLLKENSSCTLIHVQTKSLHYILVDNFDAVPKDGRPPTEEELQQFFLPFREICARKGITAKELVLHDTDVPGALTDYIIDNSISNIVVGASHWNALIRKFKDVGDPTSLVRSVPESCTVRIISKAKVQNILPTGHPQNISIKSTSSIKDTDTSRGNFQLDHLLELLPVSPDSEDINGKSFKHRNWQGSGLDRVSFGQNNDAILVASHKSNGEANSPRLSVENSSPHYSSNRNSLSFTSDVSWLLGLQLTHMLRENQEVSVNSDSFLRNSSSETPNHNKDEVRLRFIKLINANLIQQKNEKALEIEIRKLRLELEETREKYSSVCREAIAAKQKAMELEQIRQEEGRNLEKSWVAEEAALALAEIERQKTRAAMELAEMEIQKRKHAEIRAMHEELERKRTLNALAHNNYISYRKYNIEEIEAATHYFNSFLKIGEGSYGSVYRGKLDHTAVAIKVLRSDITHGKRQFQQEVEVLSTIRHPNLVLLLGACPEYGCLVYEYLENGCLEDRLFQKDNTPTMPWKIRFKIAAEIATGLLFLHKTKPEPLVHRDLKPANILLNRNYASKISDVGLARLVPPSVPDKTTQYRMTPAAGTFCYIDPEYQQTGLLGVKSDIYSLGVILLQIITAKPPMGLSHIVEKAIQKGNFPEVLDPNVTDWPVEEALSYAMVALKCCEMMRRDRPDLGSVILPELKRLADLEGATEGDNLPTSQESMINIRRRRWQPFKSISNIWSFSCTSGKTGFLPPTGKTKKKDPCRGCWSFASCSDPSPSLKKFHSFSYSHEEF